MKAIVDAVRYCHEIGIVHRDIKVYLYANSSRRTCWWPPRGPTPSLSWPILESARYCLRKCWIPIVELPSTWHPKYGSPNSTTRKSTFGALGSWCTICSLVRTPSKETTNRWYTTSESKRSNSLKKCGILSVVRLLTYSNSYSIKIHRKGRVPRMLPNTYGSTTLIPYREIHSSKRKSTYQKPYIRLEDLLSKSDWG